MRWLALAVLFLAVGCADSAEQPSSAPPVPPSIEDCLVDGRSIEFEREVKAALVRETRYDEIAIKMAMSRNSLRTGSIYWYRAAYDVSVHILDWTVYTEGTIDAATCKASLWKVE